MNQALIMWCGLSLALLAVMSLTLHGQDLGVAVIDLSSDKDRHTTVAAGTTQIYHGHVDTLLMSDGKTIYAAWARGHAVNIGPLARSDDGGLTWSDLLAVPDNWWQVSNTPTIHRLVDPRGRERLFVFAGGLRSPGTRLQQAMSEDGGHTWSPMRANGLIGDVPPKDILAFDNGQRLVMWGDCATPTPHVWDSVSTDGGLTWTPQRKLFDMPGIYAQPAVIRSPDGRQLLMLMREETRTRNSMFSVSDDGGVTWTPPRELPLALTGDRHVARYAPDGRLVVAMRDRAGQGIEGWTSPTYGHYVAWIGMYDDVIQGREGQYRLKLLHSYAGHDCGYSGLEVLPDGTFVATTYIKYEPGPIQHSVVSVRFRLDEIDGRHAVAPTITDDNQVLAVGR